MAWYEDLSPCRYWRRRRFRERPLAVGWLEQGHPFPTGACDEEFVEKLERLLLHNWNPVDYAFRGVHACSLCGAEGSWRRPGKEAVEIGWNNLFVPSADGSLLYAAPSSLIHYIWDHHYLPPHSFQDAVIACPEMGTLEYLQALRPFWLEKARYQDLFLHEEGRLALAHLELQDKAAFWESYEAIEKIEDEELRSRRLLEARLLWEGDLRRLEAYIASPEAAEDQRAMASIQHWMSGFHRRGVLLEELSGAKRPSA